MSGSIPDPLIPFYDPYDSGNPAVGASFNVQAGTTQGEWINISIPASQAAVTDAGTVAVSCNGVNATIPVNLTVWNGALPGFDAGSVNPAYADMLKTWMPAYTGEFDIGEGVTGGSAAELAPFQKYQVWRTTMPSIPQFDGAFPDTAGLDIIGNGGYIAGTNPISFTTGPPTGPGATGTTSTINWSTFDEFNGPALTPGGLFRDGTAMRVFDVGNGDNQSWNFNGDWSNDTFSSGNNPPAALMQLWQNFTEQVSQHFTSNQSNKVWGTQS